MGSMAQTPGTDRPLTASTFANGLPALPVGAHVVVGPAYRMDGPAQHDGHSGPHTVVGYSLTGCDYKLIRGHESQVMAGAFAADEDYDVFINAGRVELA